VHGGGGATVSVAFIVYAIEFAMRIDGNILEKRVVQLSKK
jgi:hypothetical protein